jgi:hypothetical protein
MRPQVSAASLRTNPRPRPLFSSSRFIFYPTPLSPLRALQPIPPNPRDARLWVLGTGGTIVAADGHACDWLGYDHNDLAGRLVEDLMMEKEAVRE